MTAGYRNLDVWKKSKELAVQVYLFTKDSSLERDYGLVDQMRRSSVSIAMLVSSLSIKGEAKYGDMCSSSSDRYEHSDAQGD